MASLLRKASLAPEGGARDGSDAKGVALATHAPRSRGKWGIVSSQVKSDSLSTSLSSALKAASLTKVVDVFSKAPADRTPDDFKFAKHYLQSRSNEWPFLKKRGNLIPMLVRKMTLMSFEKGQNVYDVDDTAKGAYVVLHGSVGVYVPSDVDEDEYFHPATRSQEELKAVQRALDTIKTIAAVEPAQKLPTVAKADITQRVIESDSEDEEVAALDVRRTWGRALRRAKMASMLNDAVAELKRGLFKRQNPVGEMKVRQCREGACFGDVGLTERLPMRSSSAVAARDTYCFFIAREDWLVLKEQEKVSGDTDGDVDLLMGLHWLRPLGLDVVQRLAFHARVVTLPAGSLVVQEGEVSSLMYVVRSGEVDVLLRSHMTDDPVDEFGDGKAPAPYHLGILGPGEVFGEKPLLISQPCDFAYITRTAVELLAIGGKAFAAIKKRVFVAMMSALSAKLRFRARRLAEVIATQARVRDAERATHAETPLFQQSEAERRFVKPVHASRALRISDPPPQHVPRTVSTPPASSSHAASLRPVEGVRAMRPGTSPAAAAPASPHAAAVGPGSPSSCTLLRSATAAPLPSMSQSRRRRELGLGSSLRLLSRPPTSPSSPLNRTHDPLRLGSFQSGAGGAGASADTATPVPSPTRSLSPAAPLVASSSGSGAPASPTASWPALLSPIQASPTAAGAGVGAGAGTGLSTFAAGTTTSRVPLSPPKQTQPLGASQSHAHTGSYPSSPTKHRRAAVHRDLSAPLTLSAPGSDVATHGTHGTRAEGFVGSGRSPSRRRKPVTPTSSRRNRRDRVRGADGAGSAGGASPTPSRRRSKAGTTVGSRFDMNATHDVVGDLLPSPVMRKAQAFMETYAGTPVEERDFTRDNAAEWEIRLDKLMAQPLRRRALVIMGGSR